MSRKNRRKKRTNVVREKRHFSIPFYIAIPCNFVLGCLLLIVFAALVEKLIIEEEVWASFSLGVLASLAIVGTSKIPKARTFLHELRHFIVVILTGNKVKDFHVDTHTGHVEFAMYSNKVHLAPFISLAPYFFPVFSIPILICCFVFEDWNKAILAIALGSALAIDLVTAYQEMHPHQTDFKKIFGGFFVSAMYLSGFHFMWTMLCLLWVLAGRSGFVYASYVFLELGEVTIKHLS